MKDGGIATLRIGEYLSDSLTGADFIACLYIYLAQVAVYGQVITMTYDDGIIVAGHYEYTGYFAIEDGTGFGSGICLNVDTAVVGAYVFQFLMLLFAEGSDDRITSGYREGQAATVAGEVVGQFLFGACHGITAFGIGYAFFLYGLFDRLFSFCFGLFAGTAFTFAGGLSFGFGTGYLFGNLLFDLTVQGIGLLLLLPEFFFQLLLFFVELLYFGFLAGFLGLELLALLFAGSQQCVLFGTCLFQFFLFEGDLGLFVDDLGGLELLPVGIFTQVTHTAHGLCEIIGGEDKEQFILRTAAFVHALHRFTVVLTFTVQFFFQLIDLTAGSGYLVIQFA